MGSFVQMDVFTPNQGIAKRAYSHKPVSLRLFWRQGDDRSLETGLPGERGAQGLASFVRSKGPDGHQGPFENDSVAGDYTETGLLPVGRTTAGYLAAAVFKASTLSRRSHGTSKSVRPIWP